MLRDHYHGIKSENFMMGFTTHDRYEPKIQGHFYGFMGPELLAPTLEKLLASPRHQLVLDQHNIIVKDFSILIARLVKDSVEAPHGAYVLAVGTGDTGWNPMAPPVATDLQRALMNEIERKAFTTTQFINETGTPVRYPTKTVDFIVTYSESEAVGPLVEMGLLGGNISTNMAVKNPNPNPIGSYDPTVDLTAYETLINYLTFPVINKPATATMTWVWRLTF
jgi:hypothetical protein